MNNPFVIPRYLFIETTTECNLRCRQCHMWMSREPEGTLTTAEKEGLVRQFHGLNPEGVVVLTGGETMHKEPEFFTLTELCRKLGLSSAANTNASYIHPGNYETVLRCGPKYLVVSLDSHIPAIHNYIRGKKGSWEHVTDTLKALVKFREQHCPELNTRIITNTILLDDNILHWPEYIRFAREELGIDGVMFQPLSRTFWNQGKGDPFFDKHFFRNKAETIAVIDAVIQMYGKDSFVLTSENDLEWMKLYVQQPDFIGEQVCGSHERNIMVDQAGDVQLCFSMRGLMNGNPLGNVRHFSLAELWNSTMAGEAREVMASCRKNCGMLNCHRKEIA